MLTGNADLEQLNLPTIVGGTYTFSFWVSTLFQAARTLTVFWDNNIISIINLNGIIPYTQYSFNVIATQSNTSIGFLVSSSVESLNDVFIDDVSVLNFVICFSGESLVTTKNIISNEIKNIKAKDVKSNLHQVYSVTKQCFVPIKYNIVTGPTNKFVLIKKDSIGKNEPDEDLYITAGHTILYNGKRIKAKYIPNAKMVETELQYVYSICTDKHQLILVNNIPVVAWGYEEWLNKTKNKNINWKDN